MKPVEPTPGPRECRVVFAKDQPEYDPLPAVYTPNDPQGCVRTEWELSAEELATVMNGGRVRLWIWTFRQPLQPVMLEVVE